MKRLPSATTGVPTGLISNSGRAEHTCAPMRSRKRDILTRKMVTQTMLTNPTELCPLQPRVISGQLDLTMNSPDLAEGKALHQTFGPIVLPPKHLWSILTNSSRMLTSISLWKTRRTTATVTVQTKPRCHKSHPTATCTLHPGTSDSHLVLTILIFLEATKALSRGTSQFRHLLIEAFARVVAAWVARRVSVMSSKAHTKSKGINIRQTPRMALTERAAGGQRRTHWSTVSTLYALAVTCIAVRAPRCLEPASSKSSPTVLAG